MRWFVLGVVVGWLGGLVSTWRVMALFTRFRDVVMHTRGHWAAFLDYARLAREKVFQVLVAGVVLVGVTAGLGWLAWWQATSG